MNELSVLMHLLSRRVNKIQLGATEEEICDILYGFVPDRED